MYNLYKATRSYENIISMNGFCVPFYFMISVYPPYNYIVYFFWEYPTHNIFKWMLSSKIIGTNWHCFNLSCCLYPESFCPWIVSYWWILRQMRKIFRLAVRGYRNWNSFVFGPDFLFFFCSGNGGVARVQFM